MDWNHAIGLIGPLPSWLSLLLIYYGIRVMDKNAKQRADDSQRKHEENMTALRELIAGQEESRMALRELIERTAQ